MVMHYYDPALVDIILPEHDGYPDEIAGEDTRDVLIDAVGGWKKDGGAAVEFPKSLWIEPNQWQWRTVGPNSNIFSFTVRRVYDNRS